MLMLGSYLGLMALRANSPIIGIGGFALTLGAILVPLGGWTELTKVLIAYAYAARIPVLIVMFLAFRGHWGTHYDAVPPAFVSKGFVRDFINLAVVPQMFLWIAFTVLVGMLVGALTAAVAQKKKAVAPAA